jgi:hypothetical protein
MLSAFAPFPYVGLFSGRVDVVFANAKWRATSRLLRPRSMSMAVTATLGRHRCRVAGCALYDADHRRRSRRTESNDLDRIAAVRQLLDELALRVVPALDEDLPWVRSGPAWGTDR